MYLRAVSVHPRTNALPLVMGRYRPVPRESRDGSNVNPRICLNGQSVDCFLKRWGAYATIIQSERLFLWTGQQPVRSDYERPLSGNASGPEDRLRLANARATVPWQPVIEKILTHLGLQARAPPRAPARGQALQAEPGHKQSSGLFVPGKGPG